MNMSVEKSVLGQMPAGQVVKAASTGYTQNLAVGLLAAGVAAMVVLVDHMIDGWAESHVLASWVALWAVAVLASVLLRGATRLLAKRVMTGLDTWSANLARKRADERLWAMAKNDSRLMDDLQSAMDRADDESIPVADVVTPFKSLRTIHMARTRTYYI